MELLDSLKSIKFVSRCQLVHAFKHGLSDLFTGTDLLHGDRLDTQLSLYNLVTLLGFWHHHSDQVALQTVSMDVDLLDEWGLAVDVL